jgi:hypothetical protein
LKVSWPDIPYQPWRETCSALHLYTQIVGKYQLARTPWVNHSWHATFYVDARGFTTSIVPDGPGGIEIAFDLIEHAVVGTATDGRTARFALGPMSVASFHARFVDIVRQLGGVADFDGCPNETDCVSRKSQSGAFVLGEFRSCGDPLFRPPGSVAPRWGPRIAGRCNAGGL